MNRYGVFDCYFDDELMLKVTEGSYEKAKEIFIELLLDDTDFLRKLIEREISIEEVSAAATHRGLEEV